MAFLMFPRSKEEADAGKAYENFGYGYVVSL